MDIYQLIEDNNTFIFRKREGERERERTVATAAGPHGEERCYLKT